MAKEPEDLTIITDLVDEQLAGDPAMAEAVRDAFAKMRQAHAAVQSGRYDSFDEAMKALGLEMVKLDAATGEVIPGASMHDDMFGDDDVTINDVAIRTLEVRPILTDQQLRALEASQAYAKAGKLIEAGFAALQVMMLENAQHDRVEDMRLAYMAGADYLYMGMVNILRQIDDLSVTEEQGRRLQQFGEELVQWHKVLNDRVTAEQQTTTKPS